jgi:hypothetical protein
MPMLLKLSCLPYYCTISFNSPVTHHRASNLRIFSGLSRVTEGIFECAKRSHKNGENALKNPNFALGACIFIFGSVPSFLKPNSRWRIKTGLKAVGFEWDWYKTGVYFADSHKNAASEWKPSQKLHTEFVLQAGHLLRFTNFFCCHGRLSPFTNTQVGKCQSRVTAAEN